MNKKINKNYEEKDKTHERRILYLLFLIFITGLMLVTSSYAWFTTNRVVTVDSLNVKVQAASGIELSCDGSEWKSMVDLDDLISVHNSSYPSSINQLPDYLEPVSTAGDIENGMLKMFYGETTNDELGNYILTASRSIETESNGENSSGKFLAFDLFLKTTESKTIYLTDSSIVTYQGEDSYGIENAVRVAFVIEGNTINGSSLEVVQGLTSNNSENVYIWEPNYDTHSLNGIKNSYNVYGITTSTSSGDRILYDGVIADISSNDMIYLSEAKASNYPDLFKSVDVDIYSTNGNTNFLELFTLQSGITKIRVYLWIEGQDVDCENNASVGNISFNLQFTTNPS